MDSGESDQPEPRLQSPRHFNDIVCSGMSRSRVAPGPDRHDAARVSNIRKCIAAVSQTRKRCTGRDIDNLGRALALQAGSNQYYRSRAGPVM